MQHEIGQILLFYKLLQGDVTVQEGYLQHAYVGCLAFVDLALAGSYLYSTTLSMCQFSFFHIELLIQMTQQRNFERPYESESLYSELRHYKTRIFSENAKNWSLAA